MTRFAAALSLLFCACIVDPSAGPGNPAPSDIPDAGFCSVPRTQVEGLWVLYGSGRRYNCDADHFNADHFSFEFAPVQVRVGDQVGEQAPLIRTSTPAEGFRLDGVLGCRRIEFSTIDPVGIDRIRRDFTAAVGDGLISGSFTGAGPENCRADGDFYLRLER